MKPIFFERPTIYVSPYTVTYFLPKIYSCQGDIFRSTGLSNLVVDDPQKSLRNPYLSLFSAVFRKIEDKERERSAKQESQPPPATQHRLVDDPQIVRTKNIQKTETTVVGLSDLVPSCLVDKVSSSFYYFFNTTKKEKSTNNTMNAFQFVYS